MNTENTNTNTTPLENTASENQSTVPIRKQSLTSEALKRTAGLECGTSKVQKGKPSGLVPTQAAVLPSYNRVKSLLGANLVKKREILHLAGSQVFLGDKNEVLMRKTPNLVMSPFECINQLKGIYNHIENLKACAHFFETVLCDWDKYTKDVES